MKRLFTLICVLTLSLPAFGQQAERRDADIGALMELLEATGFELYSFDISDAKISEVVVREYSDGKIVNQTKFPTAMFGRMEQADKISIGFYPSGNDSIRYMQFNIPGIVRKDNTPLELRRLDVPDVKDIRYYTRPFKPSQSNEFIPLVLLGSAWWDARIKNTRFCGEKELDHDLSNEIIKYIPHYYIIGVNVK